MSVATELPHLTPPGQIRDASPIARIVDAGNTVTLIIQYHRDAKAGHLDERWLANELELGLLRTCWLEEGGARAEEGRRLLLHERNGLTVDASDWSDAVLEYWIEQRRRDFCSTPAAG